MTRSHTLPKTSQFNSRIGNYVLCKILCDIITRPVAGGGAGGARAPPEIFRLELNSATKVEFFLLKWTAVNGS